MKQISLFILIIINCFSVIGQEQTNNRARWFTHDRFGMFIHWGIYSGAEGIWKGERHRDANNYAEWIYYRNRISQQEYLTLLDKFDWNEIDPEEWVILAKQAGMKYVTFTAKHHDGFALWDSKVSDYDIGSYTNSKRDIIKELATACKKHGLKMGLYYSHWLDWEHQYGWDHTKEITGLKSTDYDIYWQEKVMPQMRELLTNYGEISLMWFDMWIHHSETVVTKEQLLQLKTLIRELQPDCLVNSRLGLSVEEDPDIDFKTLGDNELGSRKENFPWQSPATVAHSWGYHTLDTEWKSTTTLLESLINNVSLNGNFMLNIGPRANGEVPYETTKRLHEMGQWLKINGESVYGAEAFELRKNLHDWGIITAKKEADKTKLYLHILNWPLSEKLKITGVTSKPDRVYFLADKSKGHLQFYHKGALTSIDLPPVKPDPYIQVIVMEYESEPLVERGLAGITSDNGFSLTPSNQVVQENTSVVPSSRRGTVPEHELVTRTSRRFSWRIYIDEPGEKIADVSYSRQSDDGKTTITIQATDQQLVHSTKNTGKTVGEPNSNWVIDNFKSFRTGKVNFSKSGFYYVTLTIEPAKNDTIRFQWLWLK